MMKCDCSERIGIEINSMKLLEDLKKFFEEQKKLGIFKEAEVTIPFYVWKNTHGEKHEWYADKWYRCNVCGTLWEFEYPDFPAVGCIRKFEDGIYTGKEIVINKN